jgi:hypothetical protein
MPSRVIVFSTDAALVETCRTIMQEVFGADSDLAVGRAGERVRSDDFCIWDCTAEVDVAPEKLLGLDPRRHLFILPPKDIVRLRGRVSPGALKIVCKPVGKLRLRSFLARAHRERHNSGDAPSSSVVEQKPRPRSLRSS